MPHASREVGSFWWKDVLRLNVLYRGIAQCTLGKGSTILFWEDLWCPVLLAHAYPNLFQAVSNTSASVMEIRHAPDLVSVLNLPLSQFAYDELLDMQQLLSSVVYEPDLIAGLSFGVMTYILLERFTPWLFRPSLLLIPFLGSGKVNVHHASKSLLGSCLWIG